jgi:hypothetical protein
MGDAAGDRTERDEPQPSLSERVLDVLVYLPTGLAVTVADELPRMTERGRKRLSVQVGSARAIGQFVVQAGGQELKRRSASLRTTRPAPPAPAASTPTASTPSSSTGTAGDEASSAEAARPTAGERGSAAGSGRLRAIPGARQADAPAATRPASAAGAQTAPATAPRADAHIPAVATLAIPGFDTLSASQVVQRLDGLDRTELVAVRAYESASRGRRTILSRVDQLLEQQA